MWLSQETRLEEAEVIPKQTNQVTPRYPEMDSQKSPNSGSPHTEGLTLRKDLDTVGGTAVRGNTEGAPETNQVISEYTCTESCKRRNVL